VNFEGPDKIESILASVRRMREKSIEGSGGGGQGGINRESRAPYPVLKMGNNGREINNMLDMVPDAESLPVEVWGTDTKNSGEGLDMGQEADSLPGYHNQQGPPSHNRMQSISPDQVGFQRRSGEMPNIMGGPQMVSGVPAMLAQKPPNIPTMDVEPPDIRAPVPSSSANSGPGSHPGQSGTPAPESRPDQLSSSSTNGAREGPDAQGPDGAPHKCARCRGILEDIHFVQCPSIFAHKFCFSCCRESIAFYIIMKKGKEAFCPSGEKCRCPCLSCMNAQGSNLPWAFTQEEIDTILVKNPEALLDKE